ncbi:MAG: ATP-binding protein [Acidimicrobiales bacterium]
MRTLFGRVLLVVIVVALIAVVATALVADRIARDDLDAALTRDFEAEQIIYTELATYAFFTGSWEGVQEVVDQMATDFDERVAVTDLDGLVLADSATEPGTQPPDLPAQEVAFIDPFDDAAFIDGELANFGLESPVLGEIDTELLTFCLDELEVPYELVDDGFGLVPLLIDPEAAERVEPEITECFVRSTGEEGEFDEPFSVAEPALLYLGEATGPSGLLADGPDWRLLGLIAVVALSAVVVTWLAVRRMFAPLGSLGTAAQAVGRGDLTARADERGVEELAALSSQFNDMAAGLEAEDTRRRRFTSDIAHELRTPLSNVRGYLEAAQDGLVTTDSALIDSLHDDTLLLQELVDDLQTLSLADVGALSVSPQSVPVAELVASTVGSHRSAAVARGVELEQSVPGDLVAWADRRRLRQVLGNLLSNAIRHTDTGGTVTIDARREAEAVVFAVRDTGEGISAEDLTRVFERFERVDTSRNRTTGGSGLGLAITHELVQLMGGRVSVSSTVGEGSVFEVVVPAQAEGHAADSVSPR